MLKKIWRAYKDSYRFKLSFVFVYLYEVLFFLVVMGILYLFVDSLYRIALTFQQLTVAPASPELAAGMQAFLTQSVISTIGFFLLLCLAYTIIQSLAWAQVVGKKLSITFVLKFLGAHVLWGVPWAVLYWFFIVGLTPKFALYGIVILSILFVYLTFLFQHAFVRGKGIKESMAAAFSTGFGKLHLLALPMLLALLTGFVWMKVIEVILNLLAYIGVTAAILLTHATAFTAVVLACVVLAPFLAWLKFYLDAIITKLAL
ncbi:hypothetical protein HY492_03330 [Candidatus Woesearchaeota archaeon]|nr:hypothetical protein [Candidatus Woesearchaeota archaeon]